MNILTIRGVSILIRFDILVFVISLIVYYLSLFFRFIYYKSMDTVVR